MKKIIVLCLITVGISGASLNNKAISPREREVKVKSIKVEDVTEKIEELDSVLTELKEYKNEKRK